MQTDDLVISGPEIRSEGVSHRPSALLLFSPHSSLTPSDLSSSCSLLIYLLSLFVSSSCPLSSLHAKFSPLPLSHVLSTFPLLTLFILLTPVFLSCSDAEEEGELEPAKELIQPIAEKIMAKYKAKEEETPLLFFVAGEVR